MFLRLCVIISIVAANILIAEEQTQGDTNVPSPVAFQMSKEENDIIHFTNREREKAGLPPLKFTPTLRELARKHSTDMAAAEKLAHTLDSKTYVQRLKESKYQYLAAGENVAWNQP